MHPTSSAVHFDGESESSSFACGESSPAAASSAPSPDAPLLETDDSVGDSTCGTPWTRRGLCRGNADVVEMRCGQAFWSNCWSVKLLMAFSSEGGCEEAWVERTAAADHRSPSSARSSGVRPDASST